MTQEHPVIPPKHLLDEWCSEYVFTSENFDELLIKAAQWGADEELKRCCALIEPDPCCGTKHQRRVLISKIKEKRRPQPKPKQVSMTVSITGAEDELESLFQRLAHNREVSIHFHNHD